MSTKLIPCGDRLLMKEIKAEKKQQAASGLYIPEEKKTILTGEIVAVGPGMTNKDGLLISTSCFKVGDKVLFSKHLADKYNHEGVDYLIINSLEVMCKIEG